MNANTCDIQKMNGSGCLGEWADTIIIHGHYAIIPYSILESIRQANLSNCIDGYGLFYDINNSTYIDISVYISSMHGFYFYIDIYIYIYGFIHIYKHKEWCKNDLLIVDNSCCLNLVINQQPATCNVRYSSYLQSVSATTDTF